LTAPHSAHGLKFNGEPHSLQYFAPNGLPWPQKLHWEGIARTCVTLSFPWGRRIAAGELPLRTGLARAD
jgi:hypothetical protein